jgi:hypothetical protein
MNENTYVKSVRVSDGKRPTDLDTELRQHARRLLVRAAVGVGAHKPFVFRIRQTTDGRELEIMILSGAGAVRRGLAVRRSRKAGRWFE